MYKTPVKIRTWTELNRFAIRTGQAAVLRAYYLIRQINTNQGGNGWLSKTEWLATAQKNLHISERQAHNLYKAGADIFWKPDQDRAGYVQLISVIKVGDHFMAKHGMPKLGYMADIPSRRFRQLSTFKAYAFAVWFARDTWRTVNGRLEATGGKIISKARLAEIFGVSESTIKNWQRLLACRRGNRRPDMTRQTTYGYSKALTDKNQEARLKHTDIPEHIQAGLVKARRADVDRDGTKEQVWQLPNKIATPQLEAFRSWHNRKLRGLTQQVEAAQRRRLYYDRAPKHNQMKDSKELRSVYILTRQRPKKGNFPRSYLLYQAVVM